MENDVPPEILANDSSSEINSRSNDAKRYRTPGLSSASCARPSKSYTGKMLSGYAILHKSNYVPIFNTGNGGTIKDKSTEIARMRRG